MSLYEMLTKYECISLSYDEIDYNQCIDWQLHLSSTRPLEDFNSFLYIKIHRL